MKTLTIAQRMALLVIFMSILIVAAAFVPDFRYALVLLAVGIVFSVFITRSVCGPLKVLNEEMNALANGNYTNTTAFADEKNEFGLIARSIDMFRARMLRAHELEEEQELNAERAETNRKLGMVDVLHDMVAAGMDSTDALIKLVRMRVEIAEASAQAQTMASSIEELAASIEQISSNSNHAADEAKSAESSAREGVAAAGEADQSMERIVDIVRHSAEDVDALAAESEKIGAIVTQIEEIAEQTNLLALNATIEAARAGDAGKGFAVVATEVKSLANETGKATVDIRERIEALRTRMDAIVDSMKTSATAVTDGREVVMRMGEQLRNIAASVNTVSREMGEVASILTEQSAASSEVARSVDIIARATERNDQEIHKVVDLMDDLADTLGERIGSFSDLGLDQAIVEIAKNDHILFKKRVLDCLSGRGSFTASSLADHQNCRFGKWYQSVKNPAILNNPAFKEIAAVHKQVHDSARAVLKAHEAGNVEQALKETEILDKASSGVVRQLDILVTALNEITKGASATDRRKAA
ncbi:MAG: HAMP domain-containing protein [Alphaproteobacteria bacterium]|nr:HAMP domain-containing protein [Alphaproteobacteria bacterium]